MFSLDEETAQKQLDALHNFCNKWGLEVNKEKTKLMITGHEPKGLIKPSFKLGNLNVKYTDEYCYLGLVLNKSGSLKTSQTTLKTKAMRAFFGLKGTVNKSKSCIQDTLSSRAALALRLHRPSALREQRYLAYKSKISFRAQTTLFDSLIKPIALYGAPISLVVTNFFHHKKYFIINH